MQDLMDLQWKIIEEALRQQGRYAEKTVRAWEAVLGGAKTSHVYVNGVTKYISEFMSPYWTALDSFLSRERKNILNHSPEDTYRDYIELLQFNMQIFRTGILSSIRAMNEYHMSGMSKAGSAWLNMVFDRDGDDLKDVFDKESSAIEKVVRSYPEAIRAIEPEFGFHFDDGGYRKVAETERFTLYQVLPRRRDVAVNKKGKPIVILPPYVLGASILAFLPDENKSYVHCFANQGIPTYIRIMKNIETTPSVQLMTGEDDAMDTRYFCETVMDQHGRPVTLNGFCQGGFVGLADLLSGELDDLVDAFITCVTPMDGTRSKALVEYLEYIPKRFRDLGYATKKLPNGNKVVDGKVMSWVYKLKSMDREAPLFTLYRDMKMLGGSRESSLNINKTAAALNYWLIYERNDLPLAITQMSFDSYTIPITADGTLPIRLFGRALNLKRIEEKKIQWLICYAEEDDLVDKEAALAPLDYIHAEVTPFPKGHGAIATSWSFPTSECSLHSRFANGKRGPVRFQMDLDRAISK